MLISIFATELGGWMGKPYSMDLRERVVAAIEGGEFDASGRRRGLRSGLQQPGPGRG